MERHPNFFQYEVFRDFCLSTRDVSLPASVITLVLLTLRSTILKILL